MESLDRMREIRREMERLNSKPSLGQRDSERAAELTAEFEGLDRDRQLGRIRSSTTGGNGLRLERGTHHYGDNGGDAGRGGVRDTAHRRVDELHRQGALPDHAAERTAALLDQGPQHERSVSAQWAAAVGDPAYATAFSKLCADPTRGHLLWEEDEHRAYQEVARAQTLMRSMSVGTDSSGGFMVPLQLDPAIMLSSDGSTNPLRQVARKVTATGKTWEGVSSAGVTAEWLGEAAEAADASPTLAQPSIENWKGSAFIPFSFEVGMDAVGFMEEMQGLLVDAADQLQAEAFTTGSGTAQPTGVITALSGTSSEIAPTTAEEFASADVYAVQNALPPRFQPRAQWFGALGTINEMAQMETTNGARLFPELSGGSLLRRPIHELSGMDASTDIDPSVSADNRVLLYGDPANFVITDRIGSTVELVPHLVGSTSQHPTGQRGLFLWFRTGSDVTVDNAYRLLNVSTTAV